MYNALTLVLLQMFAIRHIISLATYSKRPIKVECSTSAKVIYDISMLLIVASGPFKFRIGNITFSTVRL